MKDLLPHIDALDTYALLSLVNLAPLFHRTKFIVPQLLYTWRDTFYPLFHKRYNRTVEQSPTAFSIEEEEAKALEDNIFIGKSTEQEIKRLKFEQITTINSLYTVRVLSHSASLPSNLLQHIEKTIAWCGALMKNTQPMHITIYLTNSTKTMAARLTPNEINSGCTMIHPTDDSGLSKREITIWRTEDILRTIIHEMVHAADYDFRTQMNLRNINILNELTTSNELNINETFTEVATIILHSIAVCSILQNKALFYTILKFEYMHALMICNKVINHYKLPSLSCLSTNECKVIEHTNVIEYTLFKAICLRDLNTMVKEQFLREKLSFDIDEIYDFNEFLLNGVNDIFLKGLEMYRLEYSNSLRFALFGMHY